MNNSNHLGTRFLSSRLHLITAMLMIGLAGLLCNQVHASSTIFDGFIVTISDKGIEVRRAYSPYSSPSVLAAMTTKVDGTVKDKYLKSARRGKDVIHTWFLDDIPVTWEEFQANVAVGTRVSTFENRGSWYFVHASVREHGNDAGTIDAIEDGTITLRRTQANQLAVVGDFKEYKQFLQNSFELTGDAIVIRNGQQLPAADNLKTDEDVFVQQARPHMRVELLPDNFGNWPELVANAFTGRQQTVGDYLGIYTEPLRKGTVNLGGFVHYSAGKRPENEQRPEGQVDKPGNADIVTGWTLANAIGHEPRIEQRGIYYKGGWWMLDSIWVTHDPKWQNIVSPGAWYVAHTRRGRSTPDNFYQSSEAPVAWGIITSVDSKTVTLETPTIPGLTPTPTTFTIDDNAIYKRFAQDIPAEDALQPGNLIRIYAPRPQTFLSMTDKEYS